MPMPYSHPDIRIHYRTLITRGFECICDHTVVSIDLFLAQAIPFRSPLTYFLPKPFLFVQWSIIAILSPFFMRGEIFD